MKKYLKKAFTEAKKTDKKDIVAFLLCLLFAVALWLLVVGQNPEMQHEITYYAVPVTVKNIDKLSNENELSIISGYDYNINITVRGSRSKLSNYTSEDVVASVDVGSINAPGEYSLSIDVSFPPSSGFTLVGRSLDSINVSVDKLTTKKLTVTVDVPNAIYDKDRYWLPSDQPVSPSVIEVKGPERLLDTIKFAQVTVDIGNFGTALSYGYNKPIVLLDSNKKSVDMRYISMSEDHATGNISLVTKEEASGIITEPRNLSVDIDPSISSYYDIKISPEYVMLTGSRDVLDNVKSITLMSIDKTKITSDGVYKFFIVAPEGTYIASETREATVQISISDKLTKSTLALNYDTIDFVNDTDLNISIYDNNPLDEPGKTYVTILGEKSLVEGFLSGYDIESGKFTDMHVEFYVDASLITQEGIYKLPLTVKFKNSKYKSLWMEYTEVYIIVTSENDANE